MNEGGSVLKMNNRAL